MNAVTVTCLHGPIVLAQPVLTGSGLLTFLKSEARSGLTGFRPSSAYLNTISVPGRSLCTKNMKL